MNSAFTLAGPKHWAHFEKRGCLILREDPAALPIHPALGAKPSMYMMGASDTVADGAEGIWIRPMPLADLET
jgi:hypothetical protein